MRWCAMWWWQWCVGVVVWRGVCDVVQRRLARAVVAGVALLFRRGVCEGAMLLVVSWWWSVWWFVGGSLVVAGQRAMVAHVCATEMYSCVEHTVTRGGPLLHALRSERAWSFVRLHTLPVCVQACGMVFW